MRYAAMRSLDVSNGEGIGVSLFVQGCHFHCKNCFNPDTWDFNGGYEWNDEIKEKFLNLADKPHIKRITILGGEPLENCNLPEIDELLNDIRKRFGNSKQIWLYTGYTYEELQEPIIYAPYNSHRKSILSQCDILVEGRYMDELKDYKLKWRGSSNQSVIDINETRKQGKPILYCE